MIDVSNLRSPGWQRIVTELAAAAPDDRAFMLRLLAALSQVTGARQGVIFAVPAGDDESLAPRPILVWPPTAEAREVLERGGAAGERHAAAMPIAEGAVESAAEAAAAARAASKARAAQVFTLGSNELLYDTGGGKGHLIAVPIPGGLPNESASVPLRGVATLLLDARSKPALQTSLALAEVLAGYVYNHASQQALHRVRTSAASLDLAARLIASVNTARTFKGAGLQLTNDLCRQLGADRVAIAWVDGAGGSALPRDPSRPTPSRLRTRLVAISDTEHLDRRMAMAQKLEAAMDECLDQEQAVLYPLPPAAQGAEPDALLSQAVTHAHRELAATDARMKVCSVPLRIDRRVVGVLLVEQSGDAPLDAGVVELLQASMDLVAPVLEVRRTDDRSIAQRTWDWSLRTAAWAVGPRHTVWKLVGLAVFIASLLLVFVRVPYRVSAEMEIQPRSPRVVSVPYDGKLRLVGEGIKPGAVVKAGQVLAELDTTEMQLRALDARAEIVQAEKEADEAMQKNDLSAAQRASAKADQARAQLRLWELRVEQGKITAPIDGTIIAGDADDKVGATIELGQALFQIADLSDMIVVAKVDDRDIALIREGMDGQVTARARPDDTFDFVVERIVPLSRAQEGANVFEVRAKLGSTAPWFRPGVEGFAKFNTERRSLAWIASRRILDQAKLWLWW